MSKQLLNLPTHIPWKQIAVSPDMMDVEFCNKRFPFAWRSSMAISAYEPDPADLPEELCGDRITYIKVTTTITGYQPGRELLTHLEEFKNHLAGTILNPFPDTPTEDVDNSFERLFGDYFACYGSLLNVAIFPYPNTIKELVERNRIDFSQILPPGSQDFLEPDAILPNPYIHASGLTFETSENQNQLVNFITLGGGTDAELNLHTKMVVTIPATAELAAVEAKVTYANVAGVKMEAFRTGESVGTASTEAEPGQVHTLVIEADDIDMVVLTAPENEASLLEFAYFVAREVPVKLEDYPHVIDFEPKTRDLYQAATESGEILTGSKSGVTTNKALTHTDSTESSIKFGAKAEAVIPGTPIKVGNSIEASRKNTETDQDQWSVQTDASRERRETQGTTTQLSQMYNLLTGYHAGTNRAVFLMLARPHVLQPTDYRTFVQGLRAIEGMQEYFLIVSRPEGVEGLCIEASLETGHFPEDVDIDPPEQEFDRKTTIFTPDPIKVSSSYRRRQTKSFQESQIIFNVNDEWEFDFEQGEGGIEEERLPDDNAVGSSKDWAGGDRKPHLEDYSYKTEEPNTVVITGKIRSRSSSSTTFHRRFLVHLRKPIPPTGGASADIGRVLITNRELCVCFKSGECLEVIPPPVLPEAPPRQIESIVDEPMLRIHKSLLTRDASSQTRLPAMKEFLQKIQTALTTSFRSPKRYEFGDVGFLESDYFQDQIKPLLPERYLKTPLGQVKGLPDKIVKTLGSDLTIEQALSLDLVGFGRRTGLSIAEASKVRHQLLGLPDDSEDDVSVDSAQKYGNSPK